MLITASAAAIYPPARNPGVRYPAAAGGYLLDRSYFKVATPTDGLQMAVVVTEGATDTIIDWGDGNTTTVTSGSEISYTNTYATAGTYEMTIRGGCTTFNFYHALPKLYLRQILTPLYGVTNLTSCANQFRDCTALTNVIPTGMLAAVPSVTSLATTWYGCTGLTGSIPSLSANTALTTIANAWQGCTGLTGSIPSLSANTALITIANAWQSCTGLTGSIPSLSANTALTTIAFAWYGCTGLTGSIPSLSANTALGSIAYTWQGCTGLTGSIPSLSANTALTTIAFAWYGCTGLTGNYPTLSNLWKLTTVSSAWYDTRGMLANTSTVAYIFGTNVNSHTNLTTAAQCFYAANGTFTNLLGAGADFTNKNFAASFTVGIYSTNSSYRMFYNQTNLTDWATLDAAWK